MGDRAEIRLEEQAARQYWPLAPAAQARVTARLVALIEQEGAKPRTITAAARALAALGALALRQQDLDARREDPAPGQLDLRAILESDWYSDWRRAQEAAPVPSLAPALDPQPTPEALAWLDERRRNGEAIRARATGTAAGPPIGASTPGDHAHEAK